MQPWYVSHAETIAQNVGLNPLYIGAFFQQPDYGQPDLVEAADALGDLDYVVQGANLVFGIPAEKVIREIHRSNMSKLGADGKPIYREDGKVLKGPNYSPPDIASIISKAGEDK